MIDTFIFLKNQECLLSLVFNVKKYSRSQVIFSTENPKRFYYNNTIMCMDVCFLIPTLHIFVVCAMQQCDPFSSRHHFGEPHWRIMCFCKYEKISRRSVHVSVALWFTVRAINLTWGRVKEKSGVTLLEKHQGGYHV